MILTKTVIKRGKEVPVSELGKGTRMYVDVQCPVCGQVRSVRYSQIIRNGHDMCQACALKTRFAKTLEPGAKYGRLTVIEPSERSGYSVCRCECGTVKEYRNPLLIRGTTQSCGCLQKERARENLEHTHAVQKRENHPNWKGGISPERNCIEKTKAYRDWKQAVHERDGNKCVICGCVDHIETHHLASFEDAPDLRTDVDNGVTLCRSCHKKFHTKYGLNATPDDFKQYLADLGLS